MLATDHMIHDHNSVRKMLEIMNVVVQNFDHNVNVDTNDLESMLMFIRIFVDKYHHGKEENILFPKLLETGITKEGGPVRLMLNQHVVGRVYVAGVTEAIIKYKSGNQKAIAEITENMSGYIDLLSSHITNENNILYRMTAKYLTARDHIILLSKFKEYEKEVMGHGEFDEFNDLFDKLSKKYLLKVKSKPVISKRLYNFFFKKLTDA